MNPDPSVVLRADSAQVWTIGGVLQWTQEFFGQRGIDSPRLDAEVLLADVLSCDRVYLYTHFDQPLNDDERGDYRQRVKRRAAREPVAYILGRREFFSLDFKVTPAVLVPRPETEHLVEAVLAWVERQGLHEPQILDIGTGSGNIAIALACELSMASLVATDVSADALAIARENVAAHAVGDRVELLHGDVYAPVQGRRFDVVVSNPPYVESDRRHELQPEIVDYEPEVAVFDDAGGLGTLTRLCRGANEHLAQTAAFVCEFDSTQRDRVVELLTAAGGFTRIDDIFDLQGLQRGVIAERC